MNPVTSCPTVVSALGATLLHFVWQGILVAALLAFANLLLRREASNARYVAGCAALLLMIALPVATFLTLHAELPSSPSSGVSHALAGSATTSSGGKESVQPNRIATRTEPRQLSGSSPTGSASSMPVAWTKAAKILASTLVSISARAQSSLTSPYSPWMPLLVALWGVGVGLLSLRLLGGWVIAQRIKRLASNGPLEALQVMVDQLASQMGVWQTVRVCKTLRFDVPAVIGWLRPVVLVPASAMAGLSPKQLEALLAHELAHIRRHDYLVNLAQTMVETLLFYHPAVWWVSRQIRNEREHCCDDMAVAACGDRVVYARALCELARLRAAPSLAMAATSGSLVNRVRRLVGDHPSRSGHSSRWVPGVFSLVALTMMMTSLAGPQGAGVPAVSAASASITVTWKAETREAGDKIRLVIERARDRHHWSSIQYFAIEELRGLRREQTRAVNAKVRFEIDRDAGVMTFEGRFVNGSGGGSAYLVSNAEYLADLSRLGYRPAEDQLLALFVQDVSRTYIGELASLGYDKLKLDQLLAFAIHGVRPEWIRNLKQLGYRELAAEQLVAMRIHGVDPAFIRDLKAHGYRDIPTDKLLALRIHGVTPDFIAEMETLGHRDIPLDQLIAMRIHNVNPDFVAEMKAKGHHLPVEKLVAMRIHNVSPEFVREMEEAGYQDLPVDQLLAMRIHNVSPERVRELQSLGYREVPAEQLIAMQIHGVTTGFVREMVGLGYRAIPIDKLVAMRIHGVSPEFVREVRELGYRSVPVDQLVAMRIHGVSPSYIRRAQRSTHRDLSIEDLIQMKIHGWDR